MWAPGSSLVKLATLTSKAGGFFVMVGTWIGQYVYMAKLFAIKKMQARFGECFFCILTTPAYQYCNLCQLPSMSHLWIFSVKYVQIQYSIFFTPDNSTCNPSLLCGMGSIPRIDECRSVSSLLLYFHLCGWWAGPFGDTLTTIINQEGNFVAVFPLILIFRQM